jgi:hypothetical protein
MYQRGVDVWFGLAKNATEAMATPKLIGPCTLLQLGGQVLPLLLLFAVPVASLAWWFALAANAAWLAVRAIAAIRFQQSGLSAVLHPLGIAVLLLIQWHAFFREAHGPSRPMEGPPARVAKWAQAKHRNASEISGSHGRAFRDGFSVSKTLPGTV